MVVQIGLVPIFEMENGRIINVRCITKIPAPDYLKAQKRYRHLVDGPEGKAQIRTLQAMVD